MSVNSTVLRTRSTTGAGLAPVISSSMAAIRSVDR